jgi:2-polyprenyl-3-methyl-5-hydroxy-6-metoxy-1,4-benzoquinol methylase
MSSPVATNDFRVYAGSSRHEMLRFIPSRTEKALEVGCSVGNFGALVKSELKAEVWGIEIDENACAVASARLDTVICGPFERRSELSGEKFDCVIFNDVLEHMVDPHGALTYAKELLKPRGTVVASIPNVRYFGNMWLLIVHKSWKYVDTGILDRTHLRFFTKSSISDMFEEIGYDVEKIEGINPLETYDPYFMKKFRFINTLTLKQISDMRWMQFAVVARAREGKL